MKSGQQGMNQQGMGHSQNQRGMNQQSMGFSQNQQGMNQQGMGYSQNQHGMNQQNTGYQGQQAMGQQQGMGYSQNQHGMNQQGMNQQNTGYQGQQAMGQQQGMGHSQAQQASGSMTIKNPKSPAEPQVKGPEMNDRDRMNDVLVMEKYLTDSFNVAAREASHSSLHHDIMTILNETHQCQYELFELMFRKGHYKLAAAQQQELDQAYQQFSGYSSQFPYPSSGGLQ